MMTRFFLLILLLVISAGTCVFSGCAAAPKNTNAPKWAYLVVIPTVPLWELGDIITGRELLNDAFPGTEFDSRTWTPAHWDAIRDAEITDAERSELLKQM